MAPRWQRTSIGALAAAMLAAGSIVGTSGAQAPAAAGSSPPTQAPAQGQPVFRGGTSLVVVDAYPQRDGRVVEGLSAEDFQVFEDGVPQKVASFEFVRSGPALPETARRDPDGLREMYSAAADPHNRVFVTFLDTLHTTVEGSNLVRRPLVDALNRLVGADDLFGVITQDMRATDLTLGRRLQSVEDQLAKYWAWGQRQRITSDANDAVEDSLRSCFHLKVVIINGTIQSIPWLISDGPVRRYFDEVLIERRREDRTLTSLENLVGHLAAIRDARSAVIAVTDGWALVSPDRTLQQEPYRAPADQRIKDLAGGILVPTGGDTLNPGPRGQQTGGRVTTGAGDDREFAGCLTELNRLSELDDQPRFRQLATRAARSNVSVYPVSTAGLAATDGTAAQQVFLNSGQPGPESVLSRDVSRINTRVENLRTIAESTDGVAIVNTNDLATGFARITNDYTAYYLLGYYPTNTKTDGKQRAIEVRMKQPGLRVHARRGYLAASAADLARASLPRGNVEVTNTAAVTDALSILAKIRPTTDVISYGAAAGDELRVVVELASQLMEGGGWSRGGLVQLDVISASGERVGSASGTIEPGARGALVRLPLGTSTGPWRVTAKVTGDRPLGDRVDIARTQTKLVGAPVVFRATPSPRSIPRPVADFQFRRTERIHVEWPLLNGVSERMVRVLDRRGQPLALGATVTEREVDGKPALAADVNLAPLSEGDYLIELAAGSGADSERLLVAFRVVR